MSLSLRFESHNFRNSKEEEESMRLNTSSLEVAPRLSSQKMRDFLKHSSDVSSRKATPRDQPQDNDEIS